MRLIALPWIASDFIGDDYILLRTNISGTWLASIYVPGNVQRFTVRFTIQTTLEQTGLRSYNTIERAKQSVDIQLIRCGYRLLDEDDRLAMLL